MKKAIFITLLINFFLISTKAFTQIYINPGVDTTDVHIKNIVSFYSSYIKEFKGKKLPEFSKYWSKEDCEKYKIPDPSVYGLGGDYPTYSIASSKTIFYVKPLKNGVTILKTIGGSIDSLKNFEVTYITNHYIAKDENQQLYFLSPINYFKQDWQSKKLRNITYHFPKYHTFNRFKADSLVNRIKSLEKEWNVKPIEIEYFLANTYDEIQLIRGYDFSLGLGNADKPSGMANQKERIVYCAGNGENYFHEIVHIYLNPLLKKSPLCEGLAVFYGGSMGKSLDWHIKRLQAYLKNHSEIDLNKYEDFYFMDNYTNPDSTLQGLLCKIVFDKNGSEGLKRIMTYTSMNEVFEKEFKLDLKNLNIDLRKLINSYH